MQAAASDGRLPPGGTMVEYTAGTTGVSLAFVASALGYKLHVVFSDANQEMIATARRLSDQPGHWWVDHLNNHDAVGGYTAMGEEVCRQADGQVDAFVHVVGTAHSIPGTPSSRSWSTPGCGT